MLEEMVNMEKETKEILEMNVQEKKLQLKKLLITNGQKITPSLNNRFKNNNNRLLSNYNKIGNYKGRSVPDLTSPHVIASSTPIKRLKELPKNFSVVNSISDSLTDSSPQINVSSKQEQIVDGYDYKFNSKNTID